MKALIKELMYIHALFSFMVYLVGNLIVIVVLEYKLKNPHLKHTLAGFVCIALSGVAAYFIPVYFFKGLSPIFMQIIGLFSAFVVQGLFWSVWFRKRIKDFAPALIFAFALTALFAVIMYFSFMWYMKLIVKGAVEGSGPLLKFIASYF
jgi:hypothetical protein